MVKLGVVENRQLEFWALHSSGRMASAKIRMFLNYLFPSSVTGHDWR